MATTPQAAIFEEGFRAHYYLELDIRAGTAEVDVRAALAAVLVGRGEGPDGPVLALALGPALMRRLAPGTTPYDLVGFEAVEGPSGRGAPSTQHDLWVWVQADSADLALDGAIGAARALEAVALVVAEQAAFCYHDSRDMTGFRDGTANPPPEEARAVVLEAEGELGAGGAHVLAMTWIHDLRRFSALEVAAQELVIGRTKEDDVELDESVMPDDAHLARVTIETDTGELEIYRRSASFGDVGRQGLYFVAFAADPSRVRRMLEKMFDVAGTGVRDRLTEFTTPVSGANYFAPSEEVLSAISGR